jgi:hypothetical protein
MSLRLEPVRVAGLGGGEDGRLVFAGETLVAVLVHLGAPYEASAGRWFLEAGFGRASHAGNPTFAGLTEATEWIAHRLQRAPETSVAKAG